MTPGNPPSRDVLIASVLRNLSRREAPMRYITVERLRRLLYKLSDAQYAEFYTRLMEFDPSAPIDPQVRTAILRDAGKYDESGIIPEIVAQGMDSPELLAEGKRLLTDLTTSLPNA